MSTKRKQVTLAVMGSVGIHLIVLFAWAFSVQWFPAAQAASSQPPEEIKLQVVEEKIDTPPPPEVEPVPKVPPVKPVVFHDTPEVPDASQAPKDAAFQSDRNTDAASKLPASGDKPLPTQKGKQVPNFAFETQSYHLDNGEKTAVRDIQENMPPPVLETAPPPSRPVSTPPTVPASTPTTSGPADPRDLAMVTPKSIPANPADADPNPYDPSLRPPADMTEPPRPTPIPRRGGYRPMQERTETAGGIGKAGQDSIAAEATPAGRYILLVKHAVDSRYHQYVDARADIIAFGMVRIHFAVDRDGKVHSSRVVINTANEALAAVTLHALADAKIPPMPSDVAASFDGGTLEMSINFTLE